jgi:chemotaxis protein MotB
MGKWQKKVRYLNEAPVAGWQTIYGSVAMILVVFFIMMVAHSSVSRHKASQVVGYLQSDAAGGISPAPTDGSIRQTPASPDARRSAGAEGVDNDLLRFVSRSGLQSEVRVHRNSAGLVMRITGRALFPQGTEGISDRGAACLHEAAKIARARSLLIRIEGHAENRSVAGRDANSGWKLSAAMAMRVRRYLLDVEKIPQEQLIAAGFGSYRPLYTNETEEGRTGNRRVEIVLTPSR